MKPALLLLSVLALAAGRGVERGQLRIVDGVDVPIEKFNYQVSLQKNNSHECGGSIINKNWILTAAHCFMDTDQPRFWQVRVGTSTWAEGGVLHQVEKIVPWPEFDIWTNIMDVALMRLKTPIAFNERAQPVRLTKRGAEGQAEPGSYVSATGWGLLHEGDTQSAVTLQLARIRMLHPDVCTLAYSGGDTQAFAAAMVCGATYGKDTCTGDSGGPIVTDQRVQVGIVSWGVGCAEYGHPGVYTDLSYPDAFDFIKQTLAADDDIVE